MIVRLVCGAALALLAGCPKQGPTTGPTGPGPTKDVVGVGCPGAKDVFFAWYLPPGADDGGGSGSDTARHAGWVLPLHDVTVPSIAGLPLYAQVDAAAASAAGVPAPPPTVWLLEPNQPPCKATAGGYFSAADDAGTPNVAYGAEFEGCTAPAEGEESSAIAVVSVEPPSDCQIVTPRPMAARLGTEANGRWWRPTTQTPIPQPVASVLPAHACPSPDCEQLWAIATIDFEDKPVAYTGAVNWLTVPADAPPNSQCTWKNETFSGFYTVGADGAATLVTPAQDHPLPLVAALADRAGVKVLFTAGPGEYTTYDLAAGVAAVGRHLVWLAPSTDAYAHIDSLGPSCGN